MRSIAGFLRTASSFIQAFAAIGMMFLSFVYVMLTKKLRNRKKESFLIITNVSREGNCLAITAENHGITAARNISVEAAPDNTKGSGTVFLLGAAAAEPEERTIFRGIAKWHGKPPAITLRVSYRSGTFEMRTEIWIIAGDGTPYFKGRA